MITPSIFTLSKISNKTTNKKPSGNQRSFFCKTWAPIHDQIILSQYFFSSLFELILYKLLEVLRIQRIFYDTLYEQGTYINYQTTRDLKHARCNCQVNNQYLHISYQEQQKINRSESFYIEDVEDFHLFWSQNLIKICWKSVALAIIPFYHQPRSERWRTSMFPSLAVSKIQIRSWGIGRPPLTLSLPIQLEQTYLLLFHMDQYSKQK